MYFINLLFNTFLSIFNIILKTFSWPKKYSHLSDVYMQKNEKLILNVKTVKDLNENKKKSLSKLSSTTGAFLKSRDIRYIKELYHENLVKLCESYFDQGRSFITISNFEDNETRLVDILRNSLVHIDYGIVTCYILQLIMATNYLHQRKIVHSFINPYEIYVQGRKLKLGGFYFCEERLFCEQNSDNRYFRIDRVLYYECPETESEIDFKYDVWSIGCVLYELVIKDGNLIRNRSLLRESILMPDIKIEFPHEYKKLMNLFKEMTHENPEFRPELEKLLTKATQPGQDLNILMVQLKNSLLIGHRIQFGSFTYEIGDLIAKGKYYKIKNSKIPLCIKENKLDPVNKFNSLNEFEIGLIKREKHPNVVKYYEYTLIGNCSYILMEYCQDGNLDNYLRLYDSNKKKSKISINCQQEWTEQLINGMNYFHNVLKIIHRKIRPGTILLANNRCTLKYANYGLGPDEDILKQTTHTNSYWLHYMAPELNSEKYDEKSDVWSLGFVLLEICTQEIGSIDTLRDHIESLTANHFLKCLIEKMVEKNPDKRFNSEQCLKEIASIKNKPKPQGIIDHVEILPKTSTQISRRNVDPSERLFED